MTISPEELSRLRAHFPILESHTYLNSCSLGALSDRAEESLDDFLVDWHTMGASAWYEVWMGRIGSLRERIAAFLGAKVPEVTLVPTTSAALSVVAESVDYSTRNRVICTELDFPTLAYQWQVKPGTELEVLSSPDGVRVDVEQFERAVDERTAFIATSHVYFATGFVQDIAALGRIAREAGALSLIDGYQGAGQIPVNVVDAGVDIYTTGPLKWLCGGPGLSYLYVREELLKRLEPRITSWFAHEDPFAFDLENFTFAPDARRFELGTPALPTVHTALGGQSIIDDVGIERIHGRNRLLVDRLVERAHEEGMVLTRSADPSKNSAIVMVQSPSPKAEVASLAERNIIVDARPGHVRVSPHFYNTVEEVDRSIAALAEIRRTG